MPENDLTLIAEAARDAGAILGTDRVEHDPGAVAKIGGGGDGRGEV